MKIQRRRPGTLIGLGAAAAVTVYLLAAPIAGAAPPADQTIPPGQSKRVCDTPAPGNAACDAKVVVDRGGQPYQTSTPQGYGPANFQAAYALTSAASTPFRVTPTVAVVDAYDDPYAESNLATYRSTYGLSACTTANGCFRKIDQNGGHSYPIANKGWALEESLDLDAVSSACPKCNILLVEARSASFGNLGTAENTAARLGAAAISNSWGGSDFSGETAYDSYFNHPGIAITVSTGDTGNVIEYPSSSPYVTAVGGTSLSRASNARGWTETAWNAGGSGCSVGESQPTWQQGLVSPAVCQTRMTADVSADADPNTGAAVYDTYGYGGWLVVGGTSLASPLIAGVYALAGNHAAISDGSYPYSHTASLNDVTGGTNGSCGNVLCAAGPGWDGPTGLGTPNGTGAF